MSLRAQSDSLLVDSSTIAVRSFEESRRLEFLQNEAFRYDRPEIRPIQQNGWERFTRWVRYWWDQLFDKDTTRWIPILVLGLLLVSLIGTFLYLFDIRLSQIFQRNSKQIQIPDDALMEDIHNLDFETLVREARENGAFRKAVRLLYLESLKQLSDQEWIDWRLNKTNEDYLRELKGTYIEAPFDALSLHFAYVCYGDVPIDDRQYQEVEQIFRQFQSQLTRRR